MDAGVSADVDLGPIEAAGEIAIGTSIRDETRKMRIAVEALSEKARRTGTHRPLSEAGSADASGDLTLTFQAPPQSRYWSVVRYAISAQDPDTEITGVLVRLFKGRSADAFSLVDWTDRIPDVGAWDPELFTVQPGEQLFMTASGLEADTSIIATIEVLESQISGERV